MPKSIISPRVFDDERFTDMSYEARALYPHLLIASDYMGALANIKSIARGCRIEHVDSAIHELMDSGFIAPFQTSDGGTAWLVMHWFVHSKHDASKERRSQYFDEITGAFRLVNGVYTESAPEPPQNGPETAPNKTKQNDTKQHDTKPNVTQRNETKGNGNVEPSTPIKCPICGRDSLRGETKNGFVQLECLRCGVMWIDPDTGEVRGNPYAGNAFLDAHRSKQ
ncbi:hypothetical protein I7648_05535 [Collinsella tanakaei]|nr:hypothetical protein [Collinsella tanakaei]